MLRKMGLMVLVLGIGLTTVMATSVRSYVRSGWLSVTDTIRDSIPVEVEIKRARDMISDLKPEIADNLRLIAREEVELERLLGEIDQRRSKVDSARDQILRLRNDLGTGEARYVYAKREYTAAQVKENLAVRFRQFQTLEETLDKLQQIAAERSSNLEAARQKLESMLAQKRQLEVDVENLQARLTMVQVAQTSSQLNLRDSQLGQTRSLLDEIRSRIDVAERLLGTEGKLVGGIVLDDDAEDDILEQVASHFGLGDLDTDGLARN
jgi:chromosome segregation ATPase